MGESGQHWLSDYTSFPPATNYSGYSDSAGYATATRYNHGQYDSMLFSVNFPDPSLYPSVKRVYYYHDDVCGGISDVIKINTHGENFFAPQSCIPYLNFILYPRYNEYITHYFYYILEIGWVCIFLIKHPHTNRVTVYVRDEYSMTPEKFYTDISATSRIHESPQINLREIESYTEKLMLNNTYGNSNKNVIREYRNNKLSILEQLRNEAKDFCKDVLNTKWEN